MIRTQLSHSRRDTIRRRAAEGLVIVSLVAVPAGLVTTPGLADTATPANSVAAVQQVDHHHHRCQDRRWERDGYGNWGWHCHDPGHRW